MKMYLCGVSAGQCNGGSIQMKGVAKAHRSPQEAFKCYRKYLISQGYTPINNRDLREPNDGPITVLTKPCRFGSEIRSGKRGDKDGGVKTKRMNYMQGGGAVLSL